MAIVRNIKWKTKDHRDQKEVECFASDSVDDEGKRYLQLDTTGSSTKAKPGTTDQSIRFDEKAASQLKQLIEKTFPNLKNDGK
jgi:hypothetical protein